MDFDEKARIRLEHWLKHADDHMSEYSSFARELESAGKTTSAELVHEIANLAEKSKDLLEQALQKL